MQLLHGFIFAAVCVSYVLGSCPGGWVQFQNSCYKWQTDLEYWVNARLMCRMHGSDLIAIETQAEQDWFVTQAKTYNHTGDDQGFWLGSTDWAEEGKWVWESNNKAPLTFSVWGQARVPQPNNRENREQCLAAVLYFDYLWSDEYCEGLQLQYVCESKATAGPIVG